jgi:hypothetical protein
VKVEHAEELITILSDDLDGNSPILAPPITSPLVNSFFPDLSQRSLIPLSHPVPHIGHQKSLSVVDSLKRIRVSKRAGNVFKTLDFDNLDIQRMQFLPPTLNGNVLFELPPVDTSGFQTHGLQKVFVFKISEVGPGSRVHLVKRMQPGGHLEDAWIMFDHVKHVKHWTTMACHVYDSTYCRVMTIAVCDM